MERGKPKKGKKGLAAILTILSMMAAAGACYRYLPQVLAADEDQEPVLEEGQEYAYARITSMLGNEMEYVVLDAQTVELSDRTEKDIRPKDRGAAENDSGERRSARAQGIGMPAAGEMPGAADMPATGELTDMPASDGMPDAGKMPMPDAMPGAGRTLSQENTEAAEDPAVSGDPARDGAGSAPDAAVMTYRETDTTGMMQIPVGTEVETKLGTVTTFSRLSNGDIIKMLLQKDDTGEKVLIKIWIVG